MTVATMREQPDDDRVLHDVGKALGQAIDPPGIDDERDGSRDDAERDEQRKRGSRPARKSAENLKNVSAAAIRL